MDHGENYIMTNFTACIFHLILLGDEITDDEVGRTCGMQGGGERCLQGFGS
jgi:hypothetical protein